MLKLFFGFFWNRDGLAADECGWEDVSGERLRLRRVKGRLFRAVGKAVQP